MTTADDISTNSSATASHPIDLGSDGKFNFTATFTINNLTNKVKIGIVDKKGWDLSINYQNGTLFTQRPSWNQDFYLRQKLTLQVYSTDGTEIYSQVPEIYGMYGETLDFVPDKVVIEIYSVTGIDPPRYILSISNRIARQNRLLHPRQHNHHPHQLLDLYY